MAPDGGVPLELLQQDQAQAGPLAFLPLGLEQAQVAQAQAQVQAQGPEAQVQAQGPEAQMQEAHVAEAQVAEAHERGLHFEAAPLLALDQQQPQQQQRRARPRDDDDGGEQQQVADAVSVVPAVSAALRRHSDARLKEAAWVRQEEVVDHFREFLREQVGGCCCCCCCFCCYESLWPGPVSRARWSDAALPQLPVSRVSTAL